MVLLKIVFVFSVSPRPVSGGIPPGIKKFPRIFLDITCNMRGSVGSPGHPYFPPPDTRSLDETLFVLKLYVRLSIRK
jgi:hypothetical protein